MALAGRHIGGRPRVPAGRHIRSSRLLLAALLGRRPVVTMPPTPPNSRRSGRRAAPTAPDRPGTSASSGASSGRRAAPAPVTTAIRLAPVTAPATSAPAPAPVPAATSAPVPEDSLVGAVSAAAERGMEVGDTTLIRRIPAPSGAGRPDAGTVAGRPEPVTVRDGEQAVVSVEAPVPAYRGEAGATAVEFALLSTLLAGMIVALGAAVAGSLEQVLQVIADAFAAVSGQPG